MYKAGNLMSCYAHTFLRDKRTEEKNPTNQGTDPQKSEHSTCSLLKKINLKKKKFSCNIVPLLLSISFQKCQWKEWYGEIIKLMTTYVSS